MIVMRWLEASTVEELVSVGLVSLVRVSLLEKDRLERLFPFLAETDDQSRCLLFRRQLEDDVSLRRCSFPTLCPSSL